ncbi:D-malate dehydrogenase [decarboxylating] [compost metagenome]
MLDFLGYPEASAAVVKAIETVLAEGPRTRDMKGNASTVDVGNAIASLISAG